MNVDLFGGPAGWEEGAALIGAPGAVGLEWDRDACLTRSAAGHLTIRTDVSTYPTEPFRDVDVLIASPPCQAFSQAGARLGDQDQDLLFGLVSQPWHDENIAARTWADPRSPLVLQPLRWVEALRPRAIVLEQVPAIAPLWRAMGHHWTTMGYRFVTAVLNAADYGVPQVRQRAILIARRDTEPRLPAPTHTDQRRSPSLFLEPWVTMAEGLGWDGAVNTGRDWVKGGTRADAQTITTDRPAPTLTRKSGGQWHVHADRAPGLGAGKVASDVSDRKAWAYERPSTTIATRGLAPDPGANANRFNGSTKSRNDGIALTERDALLIQSFRADYPVAGNLSQRWTQIGNAIPPLLAAAILTEALR